MDILSSGNFCENINSGLSGILFTELLKTIITAQCALTNDYPQDQWHKLNNNDKFDFIVVGAGSAGSVIANRLSAKYTVLLIEAGGTPTPISEIPSAWVYTIGTKLDWSYKNEKSKTCCLGMKNEECASPRGKALGGTSTINAQFYVRGNAEDYNEWERLGNDGWGYSDVLKAFKRSEKLSGFGLVKQDKYSALLNQSEYSKIASEDYHSTEGLLNVQHYSYNPESNILIQTILDAAKELGEKHVSDINGEYQLGFTEPQSTTFNGRRVSTAKAFLNPIKDRSNLLIVKNAVVQKLIITEKRVIGVTVVSDSVSKNIFTQKEVILSAGAFNSPQILMLSGIGPKQHLESLNITVVHELNGVGMNLQDHVVSWGAPVALKPDITNLKTLEEYYYDFLINAKGPFTSSTYSNVLGFINTLKNSSIPDVQYHTVYFHFNDTVSMYKFMEVLNFKPEITEQYVQLVKKSSLLFVSPIILRPLSKGKVELRSSNPNDPPKIIGNYLESDEDIETLIRGLEFVVKLTETKALRKKGSVLKEIRVENCSPHPFKTHEYWKCLIRYLTTNLYHPVGTCKMGPKDDPFAVVDSRLRVHEISGLRIADASIMPVIVRGNTNAPSIMIGEQASDFILKYWEKIDSNVQNYL